jgi:hypothetical protein
MFGGLAVRQLLDGDAKTAVDPAFSSTPAKSLDRCKISDCRPISCSKRSRPSAIASVSFKIGPFRS